MRPIIPFPIMRPYGLRLGPGGRDGDGFDETDISDLQSGGGEAGINYK
jgi:hypothetical protein